MEVIMFNLENIKELPRLEPGTLHVWNDLAVRYRTEIHSAILEQDRNRNVEDLDQLFWSKQLARKAKKKGRFTEAGDH